MTVNDDIFLTILGEPVSTQSFRFTQTGIKYPNKNAVKEKENIRSQIIQQLPGDFVPVDGLLICGLIFKFTPIKTMKKKQKQMIEQGAFVPKGKKPDIDNLHKLIFDAMQGVVYRNDSQIFCGYYLRVFNQKPGIDIFLHPVKDGCSKEDTFYQEIMHLIWLTRNERERI